MLTLAPAPSGRAFYHIRKGKIVECLTMTDEQALDRSGRGWELWPCEWGIPGPGVRRG